MKYTSTRGAVSGAGFEEALFSGFAADGGLYMPERIPKLDEQTLRSWSSFSYQELVKEVCSLYIPPEDIPRNDLHDLIDKALLRFRHPDIVPIARLKNGLNLLEMWHGPTYAFKDLAMSCVGQFLDYFLKKKQRHVNILVATAGDTGSAAIHSVLGNPNIDIIVLFPLGRCTEIQELQMKTVFEDNVHIYAVEGTSDELDAPVRKLFTDTSFVSKHNLISINSINWGRVLVQIAHFFYVYFRCAPALQEGALPPVEVVVPTGGAGNVTAGGIAQKMGLPIKLVAAVNKNDIIHRAVQDGDLSIGDTEVTLASAMDIQEPYNMERILWLVMDGDCKKVKEMMEDFTVKKQLRLPAELHKKLRGMMTSCSVTDDDIIRTIVRCWEENRYQLCPHSAVGVSYHYHHNDSNPDKSRCCLAPASAVKFPEVILRANLTPEPEPADIKALREKDWSYSHVTKEDDWEEVLREKIEIIDS